MFCEDKEAAGSFFIECWLNCEIPHHKRELPVIPLVGEHTDSMGIFSNLNNQHSSNTYPCWCHPQTYFFNQRACLLCVSKDDITVHLRGWRQCFSDFFRFPPLLWILAAHLTITYCITHRYYPYMWYLILHWTSLGTPYSTYIHIYRVYIQ